jgi:hypothetical protein
MRRFFVFWLLVGSSNLAQAQTIQRIEILEFGIYTAQVDTRVPAPGTAFGPRDTISDAKLAQSTTTIPTRIGVRFGFRYRIVGEGNRAVKLKVVARIPPPGIRNPKTGDTTREDVDFIGSKVGEIAYTGYSFDDDSEMVPGTWTFEVWDADRKLASQSFEIVLTA